MFEEAVGLKFPRCVILQCSSPMQSHADLDILHNFPDVDAMYVGIHGVVHGGVVATLWRGGYLVATRSVHMVTVG